MADEPTDAEAAEPARPAYKLNPKFAAHTWRPGQSGNPGGRRKRPPSVYEEVEALLEKVPEGQRAEIRTLLAEVLVAKALKGDMKALREILCRSDPAVLRLAGATGGPIEFASKLVVGVDPEALRNGIDPELPPTSVPQLGTSDEAEENGE